MSEKESIAENKRIIEEITLMLSNSISSTQSEETILNQIINFLQTLKVDISTIRDSEKHTSKITQYHSFNNHYLILLNLVIQIYAIDQNLQYAKIILQSYHTILIETQSKQTQFNEWLLNESISNQNVFEICVESSNNDLLKVLGRYINIDIANKMLTERVNVFHCAAKINNIYSILFFHEIFNSNLNIHNSINAETKTKVKPLHIACYSGHSKAVDIIIDLGGDLNSIDSFQMTPLHYAVNSSNLRITKKLILYGADKTIENKDNKTPYEVALISNQSNLCEILDSKTIMQKTFKCQIEYKSLKNRRKDILLSVILLLILIIQLAFYCIIKISGSSNWYCNESSSSSLFSSKHCLLFFISFISGIIFELGTIGFVVLFTQFKEHLSQGNYLEDIEAFDNQQKPSLSEKYLMNDNMCVKCQTNKYESTIHCIACDKCIDNWDHHCFWLNCCIHNGNKCYFRVFLAITCGTVFINIINSLLYLIALGSANSKAFIADVFHLPITSAGVIWILVLFIVLLSGFLLGLLVLSFSIIIPFSKDALFERKQKKTFVNEEKQFKTEALTESRSDIVTDF